MIVNRVFAALAAAALSMTAAHAAPVSMGGYNLDSADFATGSEILWGDGRVFQAGAGGYSADATAENLNTVLSGPDARDGFVCETNFCGVNAYFDLGVENVEGDDLVVFGLGAGANEVFDLTINGTRISGLSLVDTGELIAGTSQVLTALSIDLSDWGVDLGEKIYSIRVIVTDITANKEEFVAFAALTAEGAIENPLPAASILFLCGGAGLFGAARKKLKGAKA